VKEASEKSGVP